MRRVRQVRTRDHLEQPAALRTHDAEHRDAGRDVGDGAPQGVVRRDLRLSHARSRVWQIAEVTTMNSCSASRVIVRSASMPPCSLSHCVYTIAPGRDLDVGGGDPVEEPRGVRALHDEFREARLVEERHPVAHRVALRAAGVEPVLPAVAVSVFRRRARRREPVRRAPSPPSRPCRRPPRQPVVQRRAARAARGRGTGSRASASHTAGRASRRCGRAGSGGCPGTASRGGRRRRTGRAAGAGRRSIRPAPCRRRRSRRCRPS